jgi:hypothetical protein
VLYQFAGEEMPIPGTNAERQQCRTATPCQ